jgi:4'-phosphopantetheinyl transferase
MNIYAVKIMNICEHQLNRLLLLIDIEHRSKIEKIINKEDKVKSLLSFILVRNVINQELKISNERIVIKKSKFGKPYLYGFKCFNFNISHSGDLIVCVTDNKPIGIDIEEIKPINYECIAKNFFTISEFNYILNDDSEASLSKFYKIWTLKESYIKADGRGLSIPLTSFSIEVSNSVNLVLNNRKNRYNLKSFDMFPNYKLAICSLKDNITSSIEIINQNTLINDYSKRIYR